MAEKKTDPQPQSDHEQIVGRDRYLIAFLGIVTAVGSMTTDVYIPAMPNLQHAFGTDPAAIQSTVSIFLVGLALGQLFYGPIADRFGRKVPLVGGLAVYVAGSLIAATAQSLWMLLAGRLIQAIGAAAGVVVVRAIVTDRYQFALAARVHTMLIQVMAITAIVAPMIGGFILSISSWQSIFLMLAIMGALCIIAMLVLLDESLPAEKRTPALVVGQAAVYRRLLSEPVFLSLCIASGSSLAAMFALLMGSSFVFIDQFGWSVGWYAVLYTATSVGFLIAGYANDLALRRFSPSAVLAPALAAQMAMMIALLVLALAGLSSPAAVAVLLVLTISNLAFIHGNLIALAMERTRGSAGVGGSLLGVLQYGISSLAAVAAAAFGEPLLSMAFTSVLFTITGFGAFLAAQRLRPAIVSA